MKQPKPKIPTHITSIKDGNIFYFLFLKDPTLLSYILQV